MYLVEDSVVGVLCTWVSGPSNGNTELLISYMGDKDPKGQDGKMGAVQTDLLVCCLAPPGVKPEWPL